MTSTKYMQFRPRGEGGAHQWDYLPPCPRLRFFLGLCFGDSHLSRVRAQPELLGLGELYSRRPWCSARLMFRGTKHKPAVRHPPPYRTCPWNPQALWVYRPAHEEARAPTMPWGTFLDTRKRVASSSQGRGNHFRISSSPEHSGFGKVCRVQHQVPSAESTERKGA